MKPRMPRLPGEMAVVDALATVGGSARRALLLMADTEMQWDRVHPQIRLTLTRTAFCTAEGEVTDRGRLAAGMVRGSGTASPGKAGRR